ncbi:hypothetical protein FF124_00695 [Martelella lutilitoris]|uniref:Uncharacterized protein n=1 Tax=Martelella lutilitoris TaxID=2583532 RepID=A0A5C4JW29_9HYPH|nr:hypothetical protein [Martelella lutilitoris]TNB49512.1 hypothetical protein FF124_00695 [Martelella lutilitoris]
MSLTRAIVAGAGNPMILGSIATPVLASTAKARDRFVFDDEDAAEWHDSRGMSADPLLVFLKARAGHVRGQF